MTLLLSQVVVGVRSSPHEWWTVKMQLHILGHGKSLSVKTDTIYAVDL